VTSWPWWFVESFDFKNVQVSLASEREINVTGGGAMQDATIDLRNTCIGKKRKIKRSIRRKF